MTATTAQLEERVRFRLTDLVTPRGLLSPKKVRDAERRGLVVCRGGLISVRHDPQKAALQLLRRLNDKLKRRRKP